MKPHIQSMANEAGSPPDIRELQTYDLCRLTGRSYSNLLSLAGLCRGNIELFYTSLGYSKTTRFNYKDSRYWYMMLSWISIYVPLFEAEFIKMMTETNLAELPDPQEIAKQVADVLGLPSDFLQHFSENRLQIKDFLEAIRSDLGAMAEIKLLQLIASGDAATIRWALPRLMPEKYNLNVGAKGPLPDTVEVIFGQ